VKTLFDRLFDRAIPQENGCWNYIGPLSNVGYGKISHRYKHLSAHRAAYDLCVGNIPDGLYVLHKCDNRACVNPTHLFLGTQKDNVQDCIAKGRRRGRAMLTAEEVRMIKSLLRQGHLIPKVAEQFGVARSTIGMISCNRSWKQVD